MKIVRAVEVSVDPTPEEIANVLCEMDSDQHARFFNALADVDFSWAQQLFFVGSPTLNPRPDRVQLTPQARRLMELFGEFAQETP